MNRKNTMKRTAAGSLICAALLAAPAAAQQQDVPNQTFGLTTGLVYNSNRGLDSPSQGSTTEAFTRFDFGLTFATPIQSLSLNGDITFGALDGAEAGTIPDGVTNPNIRLRYDREARNARLSVSAFGRESETSTLVDAFDGIDFVTVSDDATRLSYGYDAELELRRQAPFGITLSTGFTGLRYSDTTSTTLLDQDRYRFGATFRFNITPVLRGLVTARYSTFEEDGSPLRETFALNGSLRQTLPDGSFGIRANITSVEEGERYSLSVSRQIERPNWSVGGSLGLTRGIGGGTFPSVRLNASHTLPNGSLALNINHTIQSGLSDAEQEFTQIRFNYRQDLDPNSRFNLTASYRETNPTGAGGTTSLGTIGLDYERSLTRDWRLNAGIDHRVSTNSAGTTARDNRLSVSVRRSLSALR